MPHPRKYGIKTKMTTFRVPEDKVDAVRKLVYSFLEGNENIEIPVSNGEKEKELLEHIEFLMDFFQKNKKILQKSVSAEDRDKFVEIVAVLSEKEE